MLFVCPDMLGSASPLLIDEAPEAFGHNQRRCAKLDDLDITLGDEQIKRTAADPRVAAGIVHTHANRLW